MSPTKVNVAYFSLEIMLETDIPNFAGGLGILAGDILRSCADTSYPAVGVSLVYSGSSFLQKINSDGTQSFVENDWQRADQLIRLPNTVTIRIENQDVHVACWRYDIVGIDSFLVPVFLLDTNIPQNSPWIRDLTQKLYPQDQYNRLCQEVILGIGGTAMLKELGITPKKYHLNEGHTAFVPLSLMPDYDWKNEPVKKLCVFTTHTPVPEGHDRFDYMLSHKVADKYLPWHITSLASKNQLSMSDLAINLSQKTFAVSQKHMEVTKELFNIQDVDYVTNGIHHRTWIWPTLQSLYDEYMPGWVFDPTLLKNSSSIPDEKLKNAHQFIKDELVNYTNHHLKTVYSAKDDDLFKSDTLTITIARRAVGYKRPLLIYNNLDRLKKIVQGKKIQIIHCGKSHPDDMFSQEIVKEIVSTSHRVKSDIKIAYLENYSPKLARLLVAGSDIWLNTPIRPLEASGTSGMKAAVNGVINFSILDGWWIEGILKNPNSGWSIGQNNNITSPDWDNNTDAKDANSLYDILESEILPMYYHDQSAWISKMKSSISLGEFFNTHRVIKEYQQKAWDI